MKSGGWPRTLWIVGWVLMATMLFHIAALAVTRGPLNGPVSLRKPADFAESGWLLAWSVALILPRLHTRGWQRHVIGATTVLFGVGETTVMAIQAWRGVPSHYNFSTPLDAGLVRGGAAGSAGLFLIGVVVLFVATLRSPLAASVRLGVLAGITLLFLGCAVGFVMVSNNSGVFQGTFGSGFGNRTAGYLGPSPATVGPQYLLLRPRTEGGDLVLPHAIGVHGLLLLAVPAVLLAGTALPAARQLRVVAAMVAALGVAMAVLLTQALRQLPLDRLPTVLLGVLGLCGVALLAGYADLALALLRSRGRRPRPAGGTVG